VSVFASSAMEWSAAARSSTGRCEYLRFDATSRIESYSGDSWVLPCTGLQALRSATYSNFDL
jgi:hypothetical protein